MSSELVTVALSLAGVAVGAASSFAAQYVVMRETKKQESRASEAAVRAERKEAILALLDICQRVERAAEHRYQNEDRFVDGSPELIHEMRFRRKCLELVAGRRLSEAATEYTKRLWAAAFGHLPAGTDVWSFVDEKRDPFMEAAKAELGVPTD